MGRGAWHPWRQDQIGRRSHRAGEGSGGQVAELKLETETPKSHPLLPSAQVVESACAGFSHCHAR